MTYLPVDGILLGLMVILTVTAVPVVALLGAAILTFRSGRGRRRG